MCLSANFPVCRSVHYALGYPQHGRRKGLAVPSESICNSGFIKTRDDILLVSSIYVSPASAFRKTPSSERWFASTGGRCSSLADLLIYLRQDGCPRAQSHQTARLCCSAVVGGLVSCSLVALAVVGALIAALAEPTFRVHAQPADLRHAGTRRLARPVSARLPRN